MVENLYCEILDNKTGLVQLGVGCNDEYYIEIGMEKRDVEQSEKDGKWYLAEKCPHYTPEEIEEMERERIANLSLTKRDVFVALYKDKGITPDQIKAQITNPEALIEFEYASNYYRGNPLIDVIGQTLGYTSEQLDYLFEHKELPVGE